MKTFEVLCKITLYASLEVEVEDSSFSEQEAKAKAIVQLEDYYHLNVIGAYHHPDDVSYDDIEAIEIEE